MTMRIHGDKIEFPDGTEQFTASSGGGSTPTPEPLVWENVTADRVTDNTYTNDNDVPLYVQIDTTEGASGANFAFEIDGNRMGKIGTKDSQSSFFIVPSKATYKLIKMVAEGVIENWNEARMPLAIAVGGASGGGGGETTDILPVLYSGSINADGTVESGLNFTSTKTSTGNYTITFNAPRDSVDYVVSTSARSTLIKASPSSAGATTTSFTVYTVSDMNGTFADSTFDFVVTGTDTIAVGGGGEATGTPSSFARIVDEKPEGTNGGSAVVGNNIRDLNKVVYDDNNIVTLADNSFTLQEGTYVIEYSAPIHMVNTHKVSLRNITDDESVSQGTSEYAANASNSPASVGDNRSFGKYVVTLTKPTTYKLYHYAQIAKDGNGLGLTTISQGAPNVYATVDIEKVGTGGASSGGGEAQPPVAFEMRPSVVQDLENNVLTELVFGEATIDTNSAVDLATNSYVVPKDGIMELNLKVGLASLANVLTTQVAEIHVDGSKVYGGSENYSPSTTRGESLFLNKILNVTQGQVITVKVGGGSESPDDPRIIADHENITFSGHYLSSITGGSGGDYTPEKMVWEDKTSDRSTGGLYTNNNDVPLNVIVGLHHPSPTSQSVIKIDDVIFGYIGMQAGDASTIFPTTTSFTVPSGSTYAVNDIAGVNSTIQVWHEARMPVALGTGGGGTPSSFARIVDEKPQGSAGGNSVVGIQPRKLNKIVSDDDGIVTLSEDLNFTLQAGTYVIDYSAPVFQSNYTKIYLHSVTDNAMADEGTSGYDGSDISSGRYGGQYIVTLTEPHTYQVQQYIQNTADDGLGLPCASGKGIFTTVDIQKVGSGGGSGDSIWTEEDGRAVYDGVVKMTRNDNTLWFNADTGNSGQKSTIEANDLALDIRTNSAKPITFSPNMTEAMTIKENGDAVLENGFVKIKRNDKEININPDYADTNTSVIESQHPLRLISNSKIGLTVDTDGKVIFDNIPTGTSSSGPNMYMGNNGILYRLNTTFYSAEEVDKMLAIKDKLIEKMSARVDELEKKVK